MSSLRGALSLFARVPETARVVPGDWALSQYHGIPVWTCRVDPGHPPPLLRVMGVDPRNHVPQIIRRGVDASRVVPWIWFFRDYFGLEPEVSETASDNRYSVVLSHEETHDGELVVVEGKGESSLGTFRLATSAAELSFLRGLSFPFRGCHREVGGTDFRPVLLDTSDRAVAAVERGPRRRLLLGFDPVAALWRDARDDGTAESSAINVCWTTVMLRLLVWSAPFMVWKGFWPDDIPPLIYSVDVEAGASYFDAASGRCPWANEHRFAREPADTKMENSLRRCMERLERRLLLGTFHIDLNAIRDEGDQAAVRDASVRHDVAFHLPRIGGHAAWIALVQNPTETVRALEDGVRTLSEIKGSRVVGNRYASWVRVSSTHDAAAAVGLGYDSSSFARPPFWTVPYRMPASPTAAPLDFWEFPCVETIGAVKAGPHRLVGFRTRRRRAQEIRQYLALAARESFMVVLCDHDMALGATRGHVHGSWRLDTLGLSGVLRSAARLATAGQLQAMRGSDFFQWWKNARRARFSAREIADGGRVGVDIGLEWPRDLSE